MGLSGEQPALSPAEGRRENEGKCVSTPRPSVKVKAKHEPSNRSSNTPGPRQFQCVRPNARGIRISSDWDLDQRGPKRDIKDPTRAGHRQALRGQLLPAEPQPRFPEDAVLHYPLEPSL